MSDSKRKSVWVSNDTWKKLMEIKTHTGKSFNEIISNKLDSKENK